MHVFLYNQVFLLLIYIHTAALARCVVSCMSYMICVIYLLGFLLIVVINWMPVICLEPLIL